VRRWFRRVVYALTAVGMAVMLVLWVEHRSPAELLVPSGPLPLGRASYTWPDMTGWVWYPAAVTAPADDYLPSTVRITWERARPGFINFLTRDLSRVRAHSARGVAVSPSQPAYPVVVMRAGAAGSSLNYSSLAEDLASHGYVVVGLDIPAIGNPEQCDGRSDEEACATRIMEPLVGGIGRAIGYVEQLSMADDRFRSKLDLAKIGVFGHSFGGAQAAQFCAQDDRCRAGIDIDGRPFGSVITTGIPVPFMFLLADHSADVDVVSQRIMGELQAIYDRQPRDSRLRAYIRGSHHFTFSDDGALLKSALFRGLLRAGAGLRLNGRRQVELTAYAVRVFFDAHLKGSGDAVRMLMTKPEIVVEP
jgi:predicted dienelactone hydrolase